MRLLKDTSSIQNPTVELLYRIRRKHSGYVWLESKGKLHSACKRPNAASRRADLSLRSRPTVEPGKGRKCVILVGRPREVLKMSWNDLRSAGGLGDTEFWMHLSPQGTILSATSSIQSVLGVAPTDVVGSALTTVSAPENAAAIQQALATCMDGTASTVRYRIKDQRGYTEVITRFFPRTVDEPDNLMPPPHSGPCPVNIIAQTNEVSSDLRKSSSVFASQPPAYPASNAGRSPSAESSSTNGGSTGSSTAPFQSTFKQLTHPSSLNDNVFDELESRRPTSWQFELHQRECLLRWQLLFSQPN